jgi:hypothetical protein
VNRALSTRSLALIHEFTTPTSLNLPPDLPEPEWQAVGETLRQVESGVRWWLGDWWRFGEHRYGESASQAAPTGRSVEKCQQAAWVASKFSDPLRRRKDLSFEHHYEVAGLDADQADKILDEAEAMEWSKRDVRARRRRIQADEAMSVDHTGDLERLTALGVKLQPYDVWHFGGCHDAMGADWPGRIPGQLVCHVLYFWTNPGDLIVDPMAGSGTAVDACRYMARECAAFDVDPRALDRRADVADHDLADGWPGVTAGARLVFWDPPYFSKMDGAEVGEVGYGLDSISGLDRDEYLAFFAKRFAELRDLAPGCRLAFLMSDWDPQGDRRGRDEGIFEWHYADLLIETGWRVARQVQCPLSSQQIHPDIVGKFRASRRLARLGRYLLVAEPA